MSDAELTPDKLAPIIELTEAEVWADMLLAAPSDIAKQYGIQSIQLDSTTVGIVAQVDLLLLNRTVGLGILEPATEAQVDSILKAYHNANAKHFAIQTSPYVQPAALSTWLTARGLVAGNNTAQVARGAESPIDAHTDLTIQKIGVDYSGAFAEILCSTLSIPIQLQPWLIALVNRPRWHHYLAFDGVQPVAAGTLFVDGNVGWTGFAGTLPSHRGRGAETALLSQRIRDGVTMGCEWFVSECEEEITGHPNPAYHNLLENGFKLAYLRPNYVENA
jgi:hypothetical protein